MNLTKAKIALVFDWMTTPGGAEKINLVLHKMFPEAPIYTSIFSPKLIKGFEDAKIHTSFIQNLPFAKKRHQLYLHLMPYAYESFDLSKYDIIISSSHSCAKGIITKPETMHICYCHTPMRYAWDNWHSYIREYKLPGFIKNIGRKLIHRLRIWDRLAAERVDHYIANSKTTQKRIQKYYGKNSSVIYPCIKPKNYRIAPETKGFFLAVGRLIPYKKFDLIVETFNQIGLPLKIVGTGVQEKDLRKIAKDNIEFLGYTKEKELNKLYSECEALIFPQLEDFGITPLEAMASGRPVIAFNKGGSLDTVVDGKTGVFFEKQTVDSLKNAIEEYQRNKEKFNPQEIRKHAENFSEKNFQKNLQTLLSVKWERWESNL